MSEVPSIFIGSAIGFGFNSASSSTSASVVGGGGMVVSRTVSGFWLGSGGVEVVG